MMQMQGGRARRGVEVVRTRGRDGGEGGRLGKRDFLIQGLLPPPEEQPRKDNPDLEHDQERATDQEPHEI